MVLGKLDHYLTPYPEINLKWIKGLNLRPEIVKLLEENIRGRLLDIGLGNDFLELTPKAKATKAKNKQVGLHQTKKFPYAKNKICSYCLKYVTD